MRCLPVVAATLLVAAPAASAQSLSEMFDAAQPGGGYDKQIVLQAGVTYTGGLLIGRTFNRITALYDDGDLVDVQILGNGAILDLEGGEICISYCDNRLDIEDCVILNGNVRFRAENSSALIGVPTGSVRYVTFYEPHDYGVRVPLDGAQVLIERNIVVDAVDTGPAFVFSTGYANDWITTGSSFAFSLNTSAIPHTIDNWSYHSDPVKNADPVAHFTML